MKFREATIVHDGTMYNVELREGCVYLDGLRIGHAIYHGHCKCCACLASDSSVSIQDRSLEAVCVTLAFRYLDGGR